MEVDNEKRDGEKEKEGKMLLGWPEFKELDGGGRLRCVETGHELPVREKEAYARSKACRLALIDLAVASRRPPLNLFRPHPISKSRLICELTGDTVNKSEEHIWKHINGKRFLNRLERKEAEKLVPQKAEFDNKKSKKQLKKLASVKDQKMDVEAVTSLPREPEGESSESDEPDYWIPPVGDRWDFDNGKDRWESSTSSGSEAHEDSGLDKVCQNGDSDPGEISESRTKRMSIAIGPSSFASKKKKAKKSS